MSVRFANAVAAGLGLIAAIACSRQIEEQEEVVIDQERVDDYCATSCRRSDDCGMLGGADPTYETCFDYCSTGECMRWPDEACQEAMWTFYDCRIEDATSCGDWGTIDRTTPCHPEWLAYSADCWEWIEE